MAEGQRRNSQGPSEDVFAKVRALGPEIAVRAAAIEAERQLPGDLVESLRRCGAFRMFTPKSHGGLETPLLVALDVIAEAAGADGAVGWSVMIGCATPLLLAGLPRSTFDAIYAETPDVIDAGSTVPSGKAEREPGGYRVTGRWPFASGCRHADWMHGLCRVTRNGAPVTLTGQAGPQMRIVCLPASEWRIEDTWWVSGMKGTGSHHIVLEDHFVPDELTGPWPPDEKCVKGPSFDAMNALIPLLHAAVAVGLAEGARRDLNEMVQSGRRQLYATASMADSAVFHYEFARADADVRAARAYLERQAAIVWHAAVEGGLPDRDHAMNSMQAAVWIAATCALAADRFYTLGGGAALYDTSPLQRRLRDIHTATQHMVVQPRQYEAIGRARLQTS